MILVVEGEHLTFARLSALLGSRELDLATTVEEAHHRLESTTSTAMVLGRPVAGEAASLIEGLRAGRVGPQWLPVLAVTAGDDPSERAGIDETVPAGSDDAALEAAVERVVLLGRYRRAIHSFFDACHGPGGEPDRRTRLRHARHEADACLEAIQERDAAIPIDRLIDGG